MLGKVKGPASKAVIAFLENYKPAKGKKHPKVMPHLETILKGGNLVFMFGGKFIHEDSAIRQAWEKHKSSSASELIQCLVTGEIAPLARLHPSLKGCLLYTSDAADDLLCVDLGGRRIIKKKKKKK